jgi:hypothetical protein
MSNCTATHPAEQLRFEDRSALQLVNTISLSTPERVIHMMFERSNYDAASLWGRTFARRYMVYCNTPLKQVDCVNVICNCALDLLSPLGLG